MKQEYRIETTENPQRVFQLLEDGLYEHNANKINRHDGNLFAKVVRDETGSIVGGIGGWTWADACEITQLWVSEKFRHTGIGSKLLKAAEEEATTKKCSVVLVRTYSFQAPDFYAKYGYKKVQVIDNFPNGYSYYTLTKHL